MGPVRAPTLVLDEPLSLWGGVDVATGRIIEEGHPQRGETFAGRILVMPHGRGSSSSSSVLAELLRRGLGPAGIILRSSDSILLVGSLVARALYDLECPVVVSEVPITGSEMWEIAAGNVREVEKRGTDADKT